MTPKPQLEARPATDSSQPLAAEPICPHCGGSGTLRHGDQLFRTCLDCLGQGRLQQRSGTVQTSELSVQPLAPARVIGGQRRERISAVVSSAAAR
jgi:hypothetical protein